LWNSSFKIDLIGQDVKRSMKSGGVCQHVVFCNGPTVTGITLFKAKIQYS